MIFWGISLVYMILKTLQRSIKKVSRKKLKILLGMLFTIKRKCQWKSNLKSDLQFIRKISRMARKQADPENKNSNRFFENKTVDAMVENNLTNKGKKKKKKGHKKRLIESQPIELEKTSFKQTKHKVKSNVFKNNSEEDIEDELLHTHNDRIQKRFSDNINQNSKSFNRKLKDRLQS